MELSDFHALGIDVETLVRRLRNEPAGTTQPKRFLPAPPPIRPAGADDSIRKLTAQNQTSIPPKSAARSVAPAQMDSDRRILSAFLLCLLFGSFGAHAYYAQRRGQGALYVLLLAALVVTTLFRSSLESDAIHDEWKWRADNSARRSKQYQETADRIGNAISVLESSASLEKKEQVARDVAADQVSVEHAADQEREDEITLQNGIVAAHASAIILVIKLVCAFCLAIFLVTDFIRIIAGAYKDGNGCKITRWT